MRATCPTGRALIRETRVTLENAMKSVAKRKEAAIGKPTPKRLPTLDEMLDEALDELPENQREVFVAHELLGRSFKELAEETRVSVATLLSRKRYAVLHLRRRLKEMYEDLGKQ